MRPGRWTRSIVAGAVAVASMIVMGATAGASDETTAKKLVITKADVAKAHVGRVAVGAPGGSGDAPSDDFASLAECVGKPIAGRAVVAAAHGPVLVGRDGHSQIGSNVDIVQTKAMARADRAVVQSPEFPQCLAQLARQRGVAPNAAITSLDARRTRMKRYGDYSTAVLLQVRATSNAGPTTLSAIEVLTQRGRAELTAEFLTDGTTPYRRKDAEKILDRLAKRLDAAQV